MKAILFDINNNHLLLLLNVNKIPDDSEQFKRDYVEI